jgi:hypothetical protein
VLIGLVLARLIERVSWDSIPLPRLRGWERPADLIRGRATSRRASPA